MIRLYYSPQLDEIIEIDEYNFLWDRDSIESGLFSFIRYSLVENEDAIYMCKIFSPKIKYYRIGEL